MIENVKEYFILVGRLKYETMQVDHVASKLRWDKQEHLDELRGGRVVKGKDENKRKLQADDEIRTD